MMLRIALYGLIIYALLTAAIFVSQRRLLYLPSASVSQAAVQAAGLAFWPSRRDYRGFISARFSGEAKGTVIVFHGNAGTAGDRHYYSRAIESLGYRVLLAEYPAYGGRPGKPSEPTLVLDAKHTVELAYREFGGPIYLWGESLGAGVAAAVAADAATPVSAVILLTPWDSLASLAQTLYWFLPARWLVLDKFDNVKHLQAFRKRIAVLLAEHDEVIPKRHGLALYEAIDNPKRLWLFSGAGHNSWPVQPSEPWWREVMDYAAASDSQSPGARGAPAYLTADLQTARQAP